MARNYFSGRVVGWVGGWVAGSNENITNSAPNWVGLGLGAELGNNLSILKEIFLTGIYYVPTPLKP